MSDWLLHSRKPKPTGRSAKISLLLSHQNARNSYAKELIVLIEVSKLMPEAGQQAIQTFVRRTA